jgi:plastocyanin
MMNIKARLVVAAAAAIAGLTGCGSAAIPAGSAAPSTEPRMSTRSPSPAMSAPATSTPAGAAPSASAPTPGPVLITVKDFTFALPASVAPGARITVKNQDDQNHTFTSASKGAFDVTVTGGGTATFKAPTKPGSYLFTCRFHANMVGTLVVK